MKILKPIILRVTFTLDNGTVHLESNVKTTWYINENKLHFTTGF